MPSGILGQAALTAATNTAVYTVPANKLGMFAVNFVNRTNEIRTIRLAISDASTPADKDYLEFDASIPANGVLERTGLIANSGRIVVGYASGSGVSVNVYGFEE